ncbi:hypothetical protein JKP88DRAFT_253246 [Tribonema minus]|uniref:Uncharacterized protein n=1 Tax=Tribonema minus TaxID=303371 RepID=A0A836CMI8_9STRA|nr:hypothetical protein JKP88DRAFT_253246 [Tribonema minus]
MHCVLSNTSVTARDGGAVYNAGDDIICLVSAFFNYAGRAVKALSHAQLVTPALALTHAKQCLVFFRQEGLEHVCRRVDLCSPTDEPGVARLLALSRDIDITTVCVHHAGGVGGAVYNDGGSLQLQTSSFSANDAGQYGGAIASYGGYVALSSSKFSANTAGEALPPLRLARCITCVCILHLWMVEQYTMTCQSDAAIVQSLGEPCNCCSPSDMCICCGRMTQGKLAEPYTTTKAMRRCTRPFFPPIQQCKVKSSVRVRVSRQSCCCSAAGAAAAFAVRRLCHMASAWQRTSSSSVAGPGVRFARGACKHSAESMQCSMRQPNLCAAISDATMRDIVCGGPYARCMILLERHTSPR